MTSNDDELDAMAEAINAMATIVMAMKDALEVYAVALERLNDRVSSLEQHREEDIAKQCNDLH